MSSKNRFTAHAVYKAAAKGQEVRLATTDEHSPSAAQAKILGALADVLFGLCPDEVRAACTANGVDLTIVGGEEGTAK